MCRTDRRAVIVVVVVAAMTLVAAAPPAAPAAPRSTFDAEAHPPAPDYRDPSAWAALPDRPNPAAQAPANARPPAIVRRLAKADVFYVHPTTDRSQAHWNEDVANAGTNAWTDRSVLARQASAFSGCCRIYAPRYRQAAPGSNAATDGSGDQALDLAYNDVRRAFEYYLAHYNRGRPFLLVGHSQGSLHTYRLLAELVDGQPLQRRLVAAYAPGIPVALGEFGRRYRTLAPCDRPDDTGCIASWNGFEATGDPAGYRRVARARYAAAHPDGDGTPLCVNPLTFDTRRPAAAAARNAGALPGTAAPGPLPPLVAAAAGARCSDGVLLIDEPVGAGFALHRLPAGSLHYHEIDLFYANIRANAVARVRAYCRRGVADQRRAAARSASDAAAS